MDKSKEQTRAAQHMEFEVAPDAPTKRPAWRDAKLATTVVALVCVVMTLFGAHRSVAAQRRAVTEMFEQGVDGTGYSITEKLEDRVEYAGYLVKVANQYDELADEAAAVTEAAANLRAASGATACGEANRALTDAVTALDLAMQDAPLTEQHERYRAEYTTELTSCNQQISHLSPEYNEQVRAFNEETLGAFPLGTLARLTGVKQAEVYQG